MKIYLAPMEGLVDQHMRQTLTTLGGYDACVTEFVRVVDQLLPSKVFKRLCPELNNNGNTSAGTPVTVQLLGADIGAMAANAVRAVRLGAPGIDINFGCPSRCVTRRNGGSFLLKDPNKIHDIVCSVRQAVDNHIPISAKIRLGYENTDLALDNANAVQSAGADFITVHARTKIDGYKPPARWEWIAKIKDELNIPVVANGDISSVEEYRRCIEITGCEYIMIGRAAVSCPDLAAQIFHDVRNKEYTPLEWPQIHTLITHMSEIMKTEIKDRFALARIKQWLVFLKQKYPEANDYFKIVKSFKKFEELEDFLSLKHSILER